MLAVVKTKPEVGIDAREVLEPEVTKGHVIVEVKACGICGSDLHIYEWEPFIQWVSLPRVLGHEVAGTICEVGEGVEDFKVGDRIVADTFGGCGKCHFCRMGKFNHCLHQTRLGQHVDGGMAKYVVVPVNSLYRIPEEVDFEEASAIEPLGVILRAYERCDMKPGDDIAIIGPGPIGLFGVMLAKACGGGKTIAIGLKKDRKRLATAERFGAVTIISGEENVQDKVMALTEGRGVDVVMDVSGGSDSLSMSAGIVKRGGQIALVGLSPENVFDPIIVVEKELSIHGSFRRQPSTWYRAINLVANNVIDPRALITHVLPLKSAEEGFQLLKRGEAVKAILIP